MRTIGAKAVGKGARGPNVPTRMAMQMACDKLTGGVSALARSFEVSRKTASRLHHMYRFACSFLATNSHYSHCTSTIPLVISKIHVTCDPAAVTVRLVDIQHASASADRTSETVAPNNTITTNEQSKQGSHERCC